MDRGELGTFLFTAEHFDRDHAALALLLGLNGLRVSESPRLAPPTSRISECSRGHRTLRIVGKGARPIGGCSIGKRAGLGLVHPHMLRAGFIMAALDLRDVQIAARHADPRTTTIDDRRRENFDRHAAYVVVAYVAGG